MKTRSSFLDYFKSVDPNQGFHIGMSCVIDEKIYCAINNIHTADYCTFGNLWLMFEAFYGFNEKYICSNAYKFKFVMSLLNDYFYNNEEVKEYLDVSTNETSIASCNVSSQRENANVNANANANVKLHTYERQLFMSSFARTVCPTEYNMFGVKKNNEYYTYKEKYPFKFRMARSAGRHYGRQNVYQRFFNQCLNEYLEMYNIMYQIRKDKRLMPDDIMFIDKLTSEHETIIDESNINDCEKRLRKLYMLHTEWEDFNDKHEMIFHHDIDIVHYATYLLLMLIQDNYPICYIMDIAQMDVRFDLEELKRINNFIMIPILKRCEVDYQDPVLYRNTIKTNKSSAELVRKFCTYFTNDEIQNNITLMYIFSLDLPSAESEKLGYYIVSCDEETNA